MRKKKVIIFGSTGSIGKNSLKVIADDDKSFQVFGLLVNKNIAVLKKQIEKFKPENVCVVDETAAKKIKSFVKQKRIKFFVGNKGVEEFSCLKADISIMAIVGIASLKPLLSTIKVSKRVAIASKEALVTAGKLVIAQAKKYKTELIPVDSEINALFQLMTSLNPKNIKKIYLTASGGALFGYSKEKLKKVTQKQVLNHPTWDMGSRITVDCATLVNKGFEVMEAHYLFNMPYEKIDVLIHRQSFAHAFVESCDDTLFSCLYLPDMKIPIRHSLYYPKRCKLTDKDNFNGNKMVVSFEKADFKKFPLLEKVINCAKLGENFPVILNACDEVAVDAFLKGKIKFYDIYVVIEHILNISKKKKIKGVDDVIFWDNWSRNKTKEFLKLLWQ